MASRESDRRFDPRAVGKTITVEYLAPIPRVRDLSSSGLYLLDSHPLQLGESVELRLAFGSGEPVVVRGMVRRVDPGQGMAIEFIRIDADARRRVKEFIASSGHLSISDASTDI